MMFFPMCNPDDPPELTAEEIQAMAETIARVKAALADIVARECQQSRGLISRGYLSREGLDAAAKSLGMPPVSDDEWQLIQVVRGGAVDAPSRE